MNDQVSISIPPKTEYLRAAAAMLNAMAEANIAALPGVTAMRAEGDIAAGQAVIGAPAAPAAPAAGATTDVPAAGATTDVPAAELDKEGIPWDARIHGKAKNKNKDGTWRLTKGIDKDMVATVKAELLAAAGASPDADKESPATTAAPAAPAAPAGGVTFGDLISKVTKYTAKGLLSPQIVNQILATHELKSIAELMQKPELIATVASEIDTLCQQ